MKLLLTLFSRGSWFDFGRTMGKEEEQERIIKLLEDHGQYINNHEVYAANRLIALIKGEK